MRVGQRGMVLTGSVGAVLAIVALVWLVAAGGLPWYAAVLMMLSGALFAGLAYSVLLLRRLHRRVAKVHTFLGRHERRESRARHAAQRHESSIQQVDENVTGLGLQVEGLVATATQDRAETVMAIEGMDAKMSSVDGQISTLTGTVQAATSAATEAAKSGAETHARVEALRTELDQLRATVDGVRAPVQRLVRPEDILRRNQTEFAQVEALIDLRSLLRPRAPMPPSRGWAAAPTSLLEYIGQVLERKPSMVVECGSGVSSVWVGYALESIGSGRCVALEHDPYYAEVTRREIERHGLTDWVEVRTAPLKRVAVGHEEFDWYDPSCLDDLGDIDVVFVDGPPGATGPVARYPVMPLLRDRCTTDALFILDDAARPEEKQILEMWAASGAELQASSPAEKGWATVRLTPR